MNNHIPSHDEAKVIVDQLLGVDPNETLPPEEIVSLLNHAAQSATDRLKLARILSQNYSIIPIKPNGSKSPPIKWADYQHRIANETELSGFWSPDSTSGIAIICGLVSGNLLVLDFEVWDIFCSWLIKVKALGKVHFLKRCPIIHTPGNGAHVYLRLQSRPPAGQKLAERPSAENNRPETLIETRATGNYVLCPGSPAECHPTKRQYKLICGDLLDVPIISQEDLNQLLDLARSFDERPTGNEHNKNVKDKKQTLTWSDILKPHGYILVKTEKNGEQYWQKPNSSNGGQHITTNYEGSNMLYCFSSACQPFELNVSYEMIEVYALLNHSGNTAAAVEALTRQAINVPKRRPRLDDIGNAERFMRVCGLDVRWLVKFGKWLVWTGKRWEFDELELVLGLAKQVARSIFEEVNA